MNDLASSPITPLRLAPFAMRESRKTFSAVELYESTRHRSSAPCFSISTARPAGGEWSFDLYEKRDAGETPEHCVERRDAMLGHSRWTRRPSAEPESRVQRCQLGECQLLDGASSVGRAIDRRVVNHHDFAVRGEPHVEFEALGAVGNGEPHRLEGILRRARSSAAVRDHRSSVELDENVQANIIRCARAASRT